MNTETLGMFGHHPDPLIDYGIEIECLEGRVYNIKVGFDKDANELKSAIDGAVGFRAATPEGLELKDWARRLDADFCAWASAQS